MISYMKNCLALYMFNVLVGMPYHALFHDGTTNENDRRCQHDGSVIVIYLSIT
jgi:hypothetical protein